MPKFNINNLESTSNKSIEEKIKANDSTVLEQKIKDLKQDRDERKKYARWTYYIISVWLLMILFLVFNSSLLKLSDAVLITLVSTTTINIIGLAFIVNRYLFNK